MAANEAFLELPAGYGFSVSCTSDAGAANFAVVSFERNGNRTTLGEVRPNESHTFRALFTDAKIVIAGFAGGYLASRLYPFQDSGLAYTNIIRYDDSYGDDYDYNDLVVSVSRFKVLSIPQAAALSSSEPLAAERPHSLDYLSQHHRLDEAAQFVSRLDNGDSISSPDYSSLPTLVTSLNDQERALYNSDPVVGTRIFLEAREATAAAKSLYSLESLHNGNGDAFRHFYWNFRMVRNSDIGSIWAEKWATAHESEVGNPALEKTMDLFNNAKGRLFAAEDVDDVPSDLRAVLRTGGCRMIVGGSLVKSNSSGET